MLCSHSRTYLCSNITQALLYLDSTGKGQATLTTQATAERKKMHRISRNTNESSNLLQFLLDEVKALARKTRSAEPTPYLPYNLLRDHKGLPNSNTFPSAPKPVTGRHKLVSFHRAVYLLSNIQRHAVNLRNCILNTGPVTQYLPPSLLAHEFNRKQCRKSKASMQFQTMPFLSGERDLKAPGTPANRNSQHLF